MKEIVLLLVAWALIVVLLPLVCVYMLLKRVVHGNGRMIKVWAYKTARAIDVFGNSQASELFNDALIKEGGYKFGNKQETISSVLGKNERDRTLTWIGKIIRILIDVWNEDHCINNINEELTNTRK